MNLGTFKHPVKWETFQHLKLGTCKHPVKQLGTFRHPMKAFRLVVQLHSTYLQFGQMLCKIKNLQTQSEVQDLEAPTVKLYCWRCVARTMSLVGPSNTGAVEPVVSLVCCSHMHCWESFQKDAEQCHMPFWAFHSNIPIFSACMYHAMSHKHCSKLVSLLCSYLWNGFTGQLLCHHVCASHRLWWNVHDREWNLYTASSLVY